MAMEEEAVEEAVEEAGTTSLQLRRSARRRTESRRFQDDMFVRPLRSFSTHLHSLGQPPARLAVLAALIALGCGLQSVVTL